MTHFQNRHSLIFFPQIADFLDVFEYKAVAQSLTTMFIIQLTLPCEVFSSPFTYVLNIHASLAMYSFSFMKYFFQSRDVYTKPR